MDHAGAQDLDPALTLAGGAARAAALVALDVHLAAGLGEGEVVGAEAGDGAGTVELADDGVEGALQVRHGDALVDDQALDLVEHGGVGGVHLVLAVDPAGGDHADGDAVGLHGPDLHGGGLGAEEDGGVLRQVEGVAPLPGGMIGGGVELGEVVVLGLHLGAVEDLKAHVEEDLLDLVQDGVHGVLVAESHFLAGDGDVQGLALQLRGHGGLRQDGGLGLDGLLQGGADIVGQLAHDGALLGGELAHLLEDGGELALFAQVLHPEGRQVFGGLGLGDGIQRRGADDFQLLLHVWILLYRMG